MGGMVACALNRGPRSEGPQAWLHSGIFHSLHKGPAVLHRVLPAGGPGGGRHLQQGCLGPEEGGEGSRLNIRGLRPGAPGGQPPGTVCARVRATGTRA